MNATATSPSPAEAPDVAKHDQNMAIKGDVAVECRAGAACENSGDANGETFAEEASRRLELAQGFITPPALLGMYTSGRLGRTVVFCGAGPDSQSSGE